MCELPDFISIKNPMDDVVILKKLKEIRQKSVGLMLDFINIKTDSDKYYDKIRIIIDEFDKIIEHMNCRQSDKLEHIEGEFASLHGRRVYVQKISKMKNLKFIGEPKCADCNNTAYYMITEENGHTWYYCGECAIG